MTSLIEKYSYVTESDYQSVAGLGWPDYKVFVEHKIVPEFVYNEIDQMLSRKKPFDHPTFCVNPFYSREIPSQTHCCLLPKNYDINKIKNEMLSGKRPVECNACWKIEDNGQLSDRLIKNQTLDHWANIDLEILYKTAIEGKNTELMYKVDTSNVCNGICVTCGSGASTSWAKLEQENNIIPYASWKLNTKDIDIDYKNAVVIIFRGGEPLLSNTNFLVLEKLLEAGNTDCLISFTTNSSVQLTPRQYNILRHFANVDMCFSIDGVNKVFEYMRYPLKWQTCVDNMFKNIDKGFSISISYTISNINIAYHDITVDWFNRHKLPYLSNPVQNPKYFRPDALPLRLKEKILNNNSSSLVKNLLTNHTDQDDIDWFHTVKEIKKQDNWKNITINNYLPEISSYFT